MMVVDGWVEQSSDGGKTWQRSVATDDGSAEAKKRSAVRGHGPWSIPHATEMARAIYAELVSAPWLFMVRVVDTNGALVEQFPKTIKTKVVKK